MGGAHQVWVKKLGPQQREELFVHFARAVSLVRSPVEAAQLIQDLLTEAEVTMLSKRLAIAELLIAGDSYQDICQSLKVSYSTVARVSHWLQTSGDGYRMIVQRMEPARERDELERTRPIARSWRRRYPSYYWPQLLLEGIIASANKKQRERIKEVLSRTREKTRLHRQLERVFKEFGFS